MFNENVRIASSQAVVNSNRLSIMFVLFLFFFSMLSTQAQDWTWMKGSETGNQPGSYGTMGLPDSSNNPGGRNGSASWQDSFGNYWLFGGFGSDAYFNFDCLNDLWKFDKTSGNWTWMKGGDFIQQPGVYGTRGTEDINNTPGGRNGSAGVSDNLGNFWLFGGEGYDDSTGYSPLGNYLNDLWKFNPSTGNWTWIKGSDNGFQTGIYGSKGISDTANNPGGRLHSAIWFESTGSIWLFGGMGLDATFNQDKLNDLWKYDISSGNWTWIKGGDFIQQPGIYGTLGVPDNANTPGGRDGAATWTDNEGSFWLFGGNGYDYSTANGSSNNYLNDLWKFDITSGNWVWIKGDTVGYRPGVYGTIGVGDPSNNPGGRTGAVSWVDADGNLWLFGGYGLDSLSILDYLNDLWKFDISTGVWTWMKGNSVYGPSAGMYGTRGVADYSNNPGGRQFSSGWNDLTANELWLWGGDGYDQSTPASALNDLWKFSVQSPAVKDVAVVAVTSPVSGEFTAGSKPVSILLANYSDSSQGFFDVTYNITGPVNSGPVTESISPLVIAANDSAIFTFTAPANFSVPGDYSIMAASSLVGDNNTGNDTINIVVTIALPAPQLSSPANNAVNVPILPTLKWFKISAAATYKLQISKFSDFSLLVRYDSLLTDTSKVIPSLSGNTKYYWRVSAKENGIESDWSETWNFTTEALTPAVILLSAAQGTLSGDARLGTNAGMKSTRAVYFQGTNGGVTFNVDIPKTRSWYVWARMYYMSSGGKNSFFITAKNITHILGDNDTKYNQWHWDGYIGAKINLGVLQAGINVLKISGREPGLTLWVDQVVLTDDPDYVPNDNNLVPVPPVVILLNASEGVYSGDARLGTNAGMKSQRAAYFQGTNGGVTFNVNIPYAGTWYAWARMYYMSSGGKNSFFITALNTQQVLGDDNTKYNQWHWDGFGGQKITLGSMNPGVNPVKISGREPGLTLWVDQVVITNNPSFIPTDSVLSPPSQVTLLLNAREGTLSGDARLGTMTGMKNNRAVYFQGTAGGTSFNVNIPAAGNWYAWARMFYNSSGGKNSFFLNVNGTPYILGDNDTSYNKWHWDGYLGAKINLGTLNAGVNTVSVSGREPGLTLWVDQIVLTNNPMYNPNKSLGKIGEDEEITVSLPTQFELKQNYPNPFNPSTQIQYSIPKMEHVTLKVYDILGNEVKTLVNKEQVAGTYEIRFDASALSSGVYFYIIRAGDFTGTKKLLLVK